MSEYLGSEALDRLIFGGPAHPRAIAKVSAGDRVDPIDLVLDGIDDVLAQNKAEVGGADTSRPAVRAIGRVPLGDPALEFRSPPGNEGYEQ